MQFVPCTSRLDYLWLGLAVLLGILSFMLTPFPPSVDWHHHIALGTLLGKMSAPSQLLKQTYCVQFFEPYQMFHYLAKEVYFWVGPWWVSRVMLLFIYIFYLASLHTLVSSFRLDRKLIIFGLPLFFGFLYQLGFASNLMGVPLFVFCVAWAERWRQSSHWTYGAFLLGCLLLTFLVHPIPFFSALGSVTIYLLVSLWPQRKRLYQSAFWLFVPALCSVYYLLQSLNYNRDLIGTHEKLEPSWIEKLIQLPQILMGVAHPHYIETTLSVLWLLCLVTLILLSRRESSSSSLHWAKLLACIVCFGGYILTKNFTQRVFYVYQRFLWLGVLLALVLVLPSKKPTYRFLLWTGVGLSLVFLSYNVSTHYRWARSLQDVYPLLQKLPKDSTLIALVPNLKTRVTRRNVLRHIGLEAQIHRGGVVRPSFTHIQHMPVVDCQPKAQLDLLRANITKEPWRFHPSKHKHHAEYLLLRILADPYTTRRVYPWLFQKSPGYRLFGQKGRWILLRRNLH